MIDVVEIEPLNKFGILTSCELEREYIDENLELIYACKEFHQKNNHF